MNREEIDSAKYFVFFDDRLEQNMCGDWRFCVKISEYIIELRFPSKEESERAAAYLLGQIVQESGKRDAVFYFLTDDFAKYFETKDKDTPWIFQDKDRYIQLLAGRYFMGINRGKKSFYYCRQFGYAANFPYRIIPLLQLWSRERDMQVMHGAVVGINGKGVLITAHGGGGKSTLAVACLLAGMDFVSDDCFLINNHGVLCAMPIETTVKLNTDIMEQLNPPIPIIWNDISRNNKKTLDASKYKFCKELSIEAIIYPKIVDCADSQIIATESMPVLMQLVHSTLEQRVISDYAKESHAVFSRFFGLPTYEMRLSSNLNRNVEVLRSFIEGRL